MIDVVIMNIENKEIICVKFDVLGCLNKFYI